MGAVRDWWAKFLGLDPASWAGTCFDDYQCWFDSLERTRDSVDALVTFRLRAYGDQKQKLADWDRDWRSEEQQAERVARGEKPWGPPAAGVSVSSDLPEVWCDLRKSKAGLILPPHVLGHEMIHTVKLIDQGVIDPDLLIDEGTY